MLKAPFIGTTLRAFDVYGRGWLKPPPGGDAQAPCLGAVLLRQDRQLERYWLDCSQGYWLLSSRLAQGPTRILARVCRSQLPADPDAAGASLLAELWSLRDPRKALILRTVEHGSLGRQVWAELESEYRQRLSQRSPEGAAVPLDQDLLSQGHCVETVQGAMGTAEHVLLLRPRACASG